MRRRSAAFFGRRNAVPFAPSKASTSRSRAGETFALVGEIRMRQSPTLARCVVGLLAPTAGIGSRFSGRRVQMIFQNPYASLNPRWRIFDIIAEPVAGLPTCRCRGTSSGGVQELLEMVGLSVADARKYPPSIFRRTAPAYFHCACVGRRTRSSGVR